MKIEMTAGHMADACKLLGGIVEIRNTIPVLGMVRLVKNQMTVTDLDSELTITAPAFAKPSGSAAIDYRSLAAVACNLPRDEKLSIEAGEEAAQCRFNGSEYRMPFWPVADFPKFDDVQGTPGQLGHCGLVAAMKRVFFCVSTEETRYYLNGIAIVAGPDGVANAVATNGHQLAMLPLGGMPDEAMGAIVPSKVAKFLMQFGREPETGVFSREKVRLRLDWPGMSLSAKLIEGKYPDIYRVIPAEPAPVFSLDRNAALAVLRRLRALAGRTRYPAVRMEADGARLMLATKVDGFGATESLPLTAAPAEPVQAGYNIDYLIRSLATLTGDDVTFSAQGGLANNPTMLSCADDPLLLLLMPMRV